MVGNLNGLLRLVIQPLCGPVPLPHFSRTSPGHLFRTTKSQCLQGGHHIVLNNSRESKRKEKPFAWTGTWSNGLFLERRMKIDEWALNLARKGKEKEYPGVKLDHWWIVPQKHNHALGVVLDAKRRSRRKETWEPTPHREPLDSRELQFSKLIIEQSTLGQALWKQREYRGEWALWTLQPEYLGLSPHLGWCSLSGTCIARPALCTTSVWVVTALPLIGQCLGHPKFFYYHPCYHYLSELHTLLSLTTPHHFLLCEIGIVTVPTSSVMRIKWVNIRTMLRITHGT